MTMSTLPPQLVTLPVPVTIAMGGTGATDAPTARTNLGLGSLSIQSANAVNITGGSATLATVTATTLTVDSPTLVVDSVNHRVGISTGSPTWPLYVNGRAYFNFPVGIQTAPNDSNSLTLGSALYVGGLGNFGANVAIGTTLHVTGNSGFGAAPDGTNRLLIAGQVYCNNQIRCATGFYTDGTLTVAGLAGIGANPSGATRCNLEFVRTSTNGLTIRGTGDDASNSHILLLNAAGATAGWIYCTATATTYNTTSDSRLKYNITPLANAVQTVQAMRPVTFRWLSNDTLDHGFLAHELQQVVPTAVHGQPDAVNADGSIAPQGVDASRLVVWLVAALQDVFTRLAALEAAP